MMFKARSRCMRIAEAGRGGARASEASCPRACWRSLIVHRLFAVRDYFCKRLSSNIAGAMLRDNRRSQGNRACASEELMKKHTIGAAGMTNPIPSHPLATRAGPFLFMSGQMGLSEDERPPVPQLPGARRRAALSGARAARAQYLGGGVRRADQDNLRSHWSAAEHQGSTLQDIVFHSVYLRDMRNFPTLARTRSRLFAGGLAPPVTTSQVAGCRSPTPRSISIRSVLSRPMATGSKCCGRASSSRPRSPTTSSPPRSAR